MSIQPPSDIVLDVAQAADPVRQQAAAARLARLAAGTATADDFESAIVGAAEPARTRGADLPSTLPLAQGSNLSRVSAHPTSPYQKFEAVLLQSFVQNILPRDQDLFGDAASADECRSMLAEQIANQLAASGKIGIAKMIEAAHSGQVAALGAPNPALDGRNAAASPGAAELGRLKAGLALDVMTDRRGRTEPAALAPQAVAPAARAG